MPFQCSLPAQFPSVSHQDCNYIGVSLGENSQDKAPAGQQHSHWNKSPRSQWQSDSRFTLTAAHYIKKKSNKIPQFLTVSPILLHTLIFLIPYILAPLWDVPLLQKGGKKMRLGWKTLIIWEGFSGNIALGVKCGTPEIPSGSSSLQHKGCVCLSPAQPKVKRRMWPWERILHLDSAFHQSTKGKKKNLEEYSVSQAVQHLQHVPPPPCSRGHPFGTMSSATSVTVILRTAGRWPCPSCCCVS